MNKHRFLFVIFNMLFLLQMLAEVNFSLIMHAWKLLCLCFTRALVDDADEAVITSDCHSYCSDLEESGLPSE